MLVCMSFVATLVALFLCFFQVHNYVCLQMCVFVCVCVMSPQRPAFIIDTKFSLLHFSGRCDPVQVISLENVTGKISIYKLLNVIGVIVCGYLKIKCQETIIYYINFKGDYML